MAHIFIAVRDDNIRLLLEQVVTKSLNWTFDSAASHGVALQIMEMDPPDVLIGDISPPELDGIGLVRQLRQQPCLSDTPVVLIGSPDKIVDAHAEGAQAYITKPFRLPVLLAVLLVLAPVNH